MPRRLLIVDDNDQYRGMLRSLVSMRGYEVIVAKNGPEGLAIAQTEPIDAALTDVDMPGGMDGFEFCREVRAQARAKNQDLPVWIMSGLLSPALAKRAETAGAMLILRKPFPIDEVCKHIEAEFQKRPPVSRESQPAAGATAAPSAPPARYTLMARTLHWVVAIAVFGQLALGFWMKTLPNGTGVQAQWFNLHKSIGLTVGGIILLRLLWRWSHPPPPMPEFIPAWQRATARFVHAMIYVCLIIIPLSGYLGSSFTRYPVRYFGYPLPRWAPESPALKELCSQIHLVAVSILIVLVAVHIAKVLKHALLDRDEVFQRMGWTTRKRTPAAAPAELARSK
jgi:cytochrome b561